MAAEQASQQTPDCMKAWRKDIIKWYPKLHQRAYFVPPVFLKRLNLDTTPVADRAVAVPQPLVTITPKGSGLVDTSMELDSLAQQHIMHCLKVFAEQKQEVMFVLSQLQFISYLAEPCFAAATKTLPRPEDLKKKNQDRGDFDFLFIHRHYGLLTAEVKSVGTFFSGEAGQEAQEDAILAKKIKVALKQLKKSDDVLKYVTGDLPQRPRVTKTLMLPNVTSAQLQRALDRNALLKKDLCACLGIPITEDPSKLCLTSEQLSDRRQFWETSDDVIEKMTQWWDEVMTKKGKDPNMSEKLYEDLVSRFAGPATTVEVFCPTVLSDASKVVRTEGEGVSETAERFTDFVLFQEQLEILSSDEALVYLSGPPGTGKTVILLLQAEKWLKAGKDVHILSMYWESTGASLFLKHSLLAKYPDKVSSIHYHCCQHLEDDEDDAIDALASAAQDGELYVISDEINGTALPGFCQKLQKRVRKLHLWVARIYHNFVPPGFLLFPLASPLRSPAAVTREVQKSRYMGELGQVKAYQMDLPLHTDGPLPRPLRHQGPGHDNDVMPLECHACGAQLASVLKELHVGEVAASTCKTGSPRALQYRDVFLLTLESLSDSSGLIQGLRQEGVPVTYMKKYDVELMRQVITRTEQDSVLATDCRNVNGLERKIVVWIQSDEANSLTEHTGRLQAYSRSTAQLIVVTMDKSGPSSAEASPESAEAKEASTKTEEPSGAEDSGTVPEDPFNLDRLMRIVDDFITEDIVQRTKCLLNVKLVNNSGDETDSFFLNFKFGNGSVGRGVWPNPSEVEGTATIQNELFPKAVLGQVGAAEISQAINTGRFKFNVRDSAPFYRLEPVMKLMVAHCKAHLAGHKGDEA